PAMPSVSPGKTAYEMPSTACTTPSSVLNSTMRSRIDSSGSGTNPPLLRVERVAQAVADEVDAENDEDEHEPRQNGEPPLLRRDLAARDEHAERRRRRLDPKPEEGESGLGDDRGRHRERPVHDHRTKRVRED